MMHSHVFWALRWPFYALRDVRGVQLVMVHYKLQPHP